MLYNFAFVSATQQHEPAILFCFVYLVTKSCPTLLWSNGQSPHPSPNSTLLGCQRIDAFELWYWRRLLKVPWTARRSNQSSLKEISPGCSLEGLMLKLRLQYFGHLMGRAGSFEKTLKLGKIEGRRRRGWQRMTWLNGITDSMDGHGFGWTLGVGDGQGGLACCGSWGRKESDTTERLNWTELRVVTEHQAELPTPVQQLPASCLFLHTWTLILIVRVIHNFTRKCCVK